MRATLVVVLLGLFPVESHSDSWLCVADKSNGFNYDKIRKTWIGTTFTADEKYVVRPSKSNNLLWEVVEVGQDVPIFNCQWPFDAQGNLICEDIGNFRLNRVTLKFAVSMTYGYFGQIEKNPDMTPDSIYITIGRCTTI